MCAHPFLAKAVSAVMRQIFTLAILFLGRQKGDDVSRTECFSCLFLLAKASPVVTTIRLPSLSHRQVVRQVLRNNTSGNVLADGLDSISKLRYRFVIRHTGTINAKGLTV